MRSLRKRLARVLLVALAIATGIAIAAFLFSGGERIFSPLKMPSASPTAATHAPELVPAELKSGPSYLIKKDSHVPKVSAAAYLVGDPDTGAIILKKNPETVFPIASVSKLMTALVSLTNYDQSGTVTASRRALSTYGINGGFRIGEKLPLSKLLYPLLMESSNDAAEVISEYKNRSQFIAGMNAMAHALGLANTGYVEPTGLSPENHSTVADLFKLTSYIHKNDPLIFDITTLANYAYKNHTWYNISQFLRASGYAGSKSGYIDESKQTNIALFTLPLANAEQRNLAIILLASDDRKADTDALLKYIKANVYYGDTNAYPFAAPTEENYRAPDDEVDLVFLGDVMLGRGIKQSVDGFFGGDYLKLFENVPQIAQADIAFANLEGPASDTGADDGSIYSFRMSPVIPTILTKVGFDALSIANNHIGDWGRDAFADTLARLHTAGISPVGGGTNLADARAPTIIEKKGIKIGYLGFTDVGPDWLAASASAAGILLASDPDFDQIISDAAAKVDVLVTSFHWGEEYKTDHNDRQEMLAHRAIDNGAKLVIGTHPHVIEDTETYKGGYIAYSLGNFIFDQAFSKDTMQGLMLSVRIKGNELFTVNKKIVRFNSRTFQPEKVVGEGDN